MGKRKRENDDSDDYEYLVHTLKKLKRKMKHGRRRRRRESTDSDCSRHSVLNLEDSEMPRKSPRSEAERAYALQSVVNAPGPSTSSATPPTPLAPSPPPPAAPLEQAPAQQAPPAPPATHPQSPPAQPSLPPLPAEHEPAEAPPPVVELDSGILEIFGDDPSVVKQYGKEIQTDLAVRLQHIATTGLTKETRKELYEKYLPPSNCTLIDGPELNPEIKAAISETVIKRDKAIELKQRQLGRAIAGIGEAITILVAKEEKDPLLVKLLMDAGRLLCDNQHQDSVTRRNFVLFNLKKEMKDQIQKSKIDNLLFGADLAETLKTAKSISKSGEELKPAAASKSTATKNKTAPQPSAAPPPRNNLNWRTPPLNRRPQGNQRTRGPAPRQQHASSSRTSYRAPQHRFHSRR